MIERLLNLVRPEVLIALALSSGAAGTLGDHFGKSELQSQVVDFEKVMEFNYRYHLEAMGTLGKQLDLCIGGNSHAEEDQ